MAAEVITPVDIIHCGGHVYVPIGWWGIYSVCEEGKSIITRLDGGGIQHNYDIATLYVYIRRKSTFFLRDGEELIGSSTKEFILTEEILKDIEDDYDDFVKCISTQLRRYMKDRIDNVRVVIHSHNLLSDLNIPEDSLIRTILTRRFLEKMLITSSTKQVFNGCELYYEDIHSSRLMRGYVLVCIDVHLFVNVVCGWYGDGYMKDEEVKDMFDKLLVANKRWSPVGDYLPGVPNPDYPRLRREPLGLKTLVGFGFLYGCGKNEAMSAYLAFCRECPSFIPSEDMHVYRGVGREEWYNEAIRYIRDERLYPDDEPGGRLCHGFGEDDSVDY